MTGVGGGQDFPSEAIIERKPDARCLSVNLQCRKLKRLKQYFHENV